MFSVVTFYLVSSECALIRSRHAGQVPRDLAVPVPEIWDGNGTHNKIRYWDPDSNWKFAGFGIGTEIWKIRDSGLGPTLEQPTGTQRFGPVPLIKKNRNSVPGTENFPGHGPRPVPSPGSNGIIQLVYRVFKIYPVGNFYKILKYHE